MDVTTGALYKRGKIWHWEYRVDGRRKYKSLKTTSKEIAMAKRRTLLAQLQEHIGALNGNNHPLPIWEKLVETSYKAKGRPATLPEVMRAVREFIAVCKASTLAGITSPDIDALVSQWRTRGLKAQTANTRIGLLPLLQEKSRGLLIPTSLSFTAVGIPRGSRRTEGRRRFEGETSKIGKPRSVIPSERADVGAGMRVRSFLRPAGGATRVASSLFPAISAFRDASAFASGAKPARVAASHWVTGAGEHPADERLRGLRRRATHESCDPAQNMCR
jgi:hypothetical protein